MELNEFITKVLVEITNGIKSANSQLGENASYGMEPFRRDKETGFIAFDLAVKTSEKQDKGAKGGIQVLNLGVGGKFDKSSTHESANRIKFYIMPNKHIG